MFRLLRPTNDHQMKDKFDVQSDDKFLDLF